MAHNICSICGSTEDREYISVEGIYVSKCPNCGYIELPKKKEDNYNAEISQKFSFLREANDFLAEIFNNIDNPEKIRWRSNFLHGDVTAFLNTPLYGMLYAAWLTKGFTAEKNSGEKVVLETVYNNALALKGKSVVLDLLVNLYENSVKIDAEENRRKAEKKQSRIRKAIVSITALVVIAIASCAIGVITYAPTVKDEVTGVSVHVFNNSVSVFQKADISLTVEKHTAESRHYQEAMSILKHQTDVISVYNVNMSSKDRTPRLKKAVSFTFPIPEGYDSSCIKVYYIENNSYKEIASRVSPANNTISFDENKLGIYVIAENHPKVVFDTAGGNEIDPAFIKKGELIQKPEAPTRAGYDFVSWYHNGLEWNFEVDKVKSDMTLSAVWKPHKYTVSYNVDGGSPAIITSHDVTYGQPYNLPTPTKTGYSFDGWYYNGDKYSSADAWQTLENVELTARWIAIKYTLTFDTDGGTPTDPVIAEYGDSIVAPLDPEKEHYDFAGWDIVIPETMPAYNFTATAKWNPKNYTVTFLDFDGSVIAVINQPYGTKLTAPSIPAVNGWTFVDWDTELPDTVPGYDITVNAVRTEAGCKVTFKTNSDGKKGMFTISDGYESVFYNITLKLKTVAQSEGYDFAGWSLDETGAIMLTDASGEFLCDIIEYTNANGVWIHTSSEIVTLYAQWVAKECAVTFDVSGGVGAPENAVLSYDYPELPTPGRIDHIFLGWFLPDGTRVVDVSQIIAQDSCTLTAQWFKVATTIKKRTDGSRVTITDADRYSETFGTGLNIDELISAGYTRLTLTFSLEMKEENDGYQDVWIGINDVEGNYKEICSKTYETPDKARVIVYINLTIDIADISNTDTITIRYGAHGKLDDDWYLYETVITIVASK